MFELSFSQSLGPVYISVDCLNSRQDSSYINLSIDHSNWTLPDVTAVGIALVPNSSRVHDLHDEENFTYAYISGHDEGESIFDGKQASSPYFF